MLLQVSQVSKMHSSRRSTDILCERCVEAFFKAGGCVAHQTGDEATEQKIIQLMADCPMECHVKALERCDMTVETDAGESAAECSVECISTFDTLGGCTALTGSNPAGAEAVMALPELSGCDLESCADEVIGHCFPNVDEEFCDACALGFDEAGGCDAVRGIETGSETTTGGEGLSSQTLGKFVPAGCWPCGEQAMLHCAQKWRNAGLKTLLTCADCIDALDDMEDGCASPLTENSTGPAQMPAQCEGIGRLCLDLVNARCGDAAQECHTSRPGDACFKHAKWALVHGITLHPEWYPDLTLNSSLEDFQRHLNVTGHHDCPQPCKPMPVTLCHTAEPGEDCHRHVSWAMEMGIRVMPESYPSFLTKDSSFKEFQTWMWRIHHGSCLPPCSE